MEFLTGLVTMIREGTISAKVDELRTAEAKYELQNLQRQVI